MSKTIHRGVKALKTDFDFGTLNSATKTKVRNIIGLYDDRKIAQFTTADKLLRNFINAKTEQLKQKASDQYNKVCEKNTRKRNHWEKECKQQSVTTNSQKPADD